VHVKYKRQVQHQSAITTDILNIVAESLASAGRKRSHMTLFHKKKKLSATFQINEKKCLIKRDMLY